MSQTEQETRSTNLSFLGRSATLNSLFTLEGGAGFLLDLVVAAAFGLSVQSDALYAAWMLPQAVGRGMFQGLTNSFMGLFVDREDHTEAYNQAITFITLLALPLAGILSVTSSWWLPLTIPATTLQTKLTAIPLARILAWIVGFSALAETFRAAHYQEGCWWLPSLARLVETSVVIGLVLATGQEKSLMLIAWGLMIGTGLEALIGFIGLHLVLGVKYRPLWPAKDKLQEMATMVGIPLVGQSILVLVGMGERALASLLPPGSITAITYANRIINTLERFVFRGFVISTVHMYPSEGENSLRAHFRLMILISIPIITVFSVLPHPLVAAVFGRGSFTSTDVQALAMVLQMYAPAILGIALTRIPFGLAYAKKRVDVILGFFIMFSTTLLPTEALFIHLGLGLRTFGLSYALAISMAFVWLYSTLLRSQGRYVWTWPDSVQLLAVGLSTLTGTALLVSLIGQWETGSPWSDWCTLAAGLSSCGLFIIAASYALKLDEARQLLRIVKGLRS